MVELLEHEGDWVANSEHNHVNAFVPLRVRVLSAWGLLYEYLMPRVLVNGSILESWVVFNWKKDFPKFCHF
jgi:hypothetical protein